MGYNPKSHKESNTTEWFSSHARTLWLFFLNDTFAHLLDFENYFEIVFAYLYGEKKPTRNILSCVDNLSTLLPVNEGMCQILLMSYLN